MEESRGDLPEVAPKREKGIRLVLSRFMEEDLAHGMSHRDALNSKRGRIRYEWHQGSLINYLHN